MDLPTETIRNIMRYLPFQEIMKLRRVNKRLWLLSGMKSLWKDITISNAPLSCGLISIALSKEVETLNIRNCTIQGSYLKMLNLGHSLQEGLSKLKFLRRDGGFGIPPLRYTYNETASRQMLIPHGCNIIRI